ncbi:MAG: entericidin EcnA/B family protein [Marinosulfonomonas sp.]|nr:entericidin EcnA/B family protein [Marinosulfonomonas sp.]
MKKIIMTTFFLMLASCGTVAGVGDDLSAGARTVKGWF